VGGRHPHVDDAHVRAVGLDGAEQLVAVLDGGDDVETRLGQEALEPGTQQHRVLRDHEAHGSSTTSRVGPPGGLDNASRPSTAATRLASPGSPDPEARSAPPSPSSSTSTRQRPGRTTSTR